MSKSPAPDVESPNRFEILGAMGLTAVLLLIFAKLWLYFGEMHLLPLIFKLSDLGIAIALGLVITGLSNIVYRLWPAYRTSADFYLAFVMKPLAWPDLLWLGLLPGISEELLFRGVMLPSLGYNAVGVVLAALCFGLLHMSGTRQWPYALWAGTVGIILGYALLFTGNMLVPVGAHVCCNLCSGVIWKWQNQ
jgi:uncharacterized protein